MTTAGKLWLGFGLLLVLLAGTGLFVAHRLALIERALTTIMAVQEPATAMTYELAVNVITTRSSVLHYGDSGDEAERRRVEDLIAEFARHKQRFDEVARSATSRDLGHRIDVAFVEFRRLADSLMTLSDRQRAHSRAFVERSDDLRQRIDFGLRTHLDIRGKEGPRRVIDTSRLEADVEGVGAALGQFLETHEPRHRVRIAFHETHFNVTVGDLEESGLDADERGRVQAIESAFAREVEEARAVVDIADERRGVHARFLASGATLEQLVDEGIRSLARNDLVLAQQSAHQALRTSLIAVLLLLIAGIAIGCATAIPTAGSIVRAELDLRERMRELADSHKRKDEFLGVLGHELRNPLAPISNALTALAAPRADVPPDVRRALEMMHRQVRSMSRLVEELLDVSRINQGKITLRPETVDLSRIAAETATDLEPLIRGRRHRLDVLRPAEPVWIQADPTRIAQVTSNLLQNAIKYTPDGGHIVLEVTAPDSQAVLRVTDDGIGLAPAMLPLVFEPFLQGDSSPTRSQGGLGIGLTLVNRLVELHHGRITVESPGVGQGSTFTVKLPLVAAPIARADRAERAREPSPSRSKRVLVVDDNRDSAESMAILLQLWGHETQVVHDGPSALAAAESHEPDVVLLDIGLPGMDGYEVARRLRERSDRSRLMLIALTGLGREEDRIQALDAGFDRHLTKPVSPEVLQEILGAVDLAAS
jgi:signal transduction histidine kinase